MSCHFLSYRLLPTYVLSYYVTLVASHVKELRLRALAVARFQPLDAGGRERRSGDPRPELLYPKDVAEVVHVSRLCRYFGG